MTEFEIKRLAIKKQLNSYLDIRAEYLQIKEELQRVEALVHAPGAPNMSGMPPSHNNGTSPVERVAIRHLTLLERYSAQLARLADAQLTVENVIESLEPTERRLARFRYIDGLPWESVCTALNYSWRQTHRIHGRMLDKLTAAAIAQEARD